MSVMCQFRQADFSLFRAKIARRVLNVWTVHVCQKHREKRFETVINAEVQLNAYGRLRVKAKMKV